MKCPVLFLFASGKSCDKGTEIGEKNLLTVREASEYFNIGIKKMRRIAEEHVGDFAIISGNKYLVIRVKFEKNLNETSTI